MARVTAEEFRRLTVPPKRSLWVEVIERRKAWAGQQPGPAESMETWTAADLGWLDRLEETVLIATEARTGQSQVDPRAALVDVLAVVSAWVDAMDGR